MNGFPAPAVAILLCTVPLLWLVVRGSFPGRPRAAAVDETGTARSGGWSPAVRVALVLFVLWLVADIIAISMLGGPKQPTFRTVDSAGEPPAAPRLEGGGAATGGRK
jgi:hypothetical protein